MGIFFLYCEDIVLLSSVVIVSVEKSNDGLIFAPLKIIQNFPPEGRRKQGAEETIPGPNYFISGSINFTQTLPESRRGNIS